MKKLLLTAAVVAAGAFPAVGQAQSPVQPIDVVAVRQAGMGTLYGTWRAMRSAAETKAEPKNFILAAKGAAAFGRQIPALFPPAAGPGRLGLPAIMENRAGFEQAAAAMTAAAEALLKVTQANDSEAFPAAAKAFSDSCGGCHPRNFARNWNE
jgi:cytochrome c556